MAIWRNGAKRPCGGTQVTQKTGRARRKLQAGGPNNDQRQASKALIEPRRLGLKTNAHSRASRPSGDHHWPFFGRSATPKCACCHRQSARDAENASN